MSGTSGSWAEWPWAVAAILFLAGCAWRNKRTGFRPARPARSAWSDLHFRLLQLRVELEPPEPAAPEETASRPPGAVPRSSEVTSEISGQLVRLDQVLRPAAAEKNTPQSTARR